MRLAVGSAFGVLMLVGVGLGLWLMVASYSPVPFADFWGQIPFLDRAIKGDLRIGDLWAQWNEHRIFVPRLEFALEYAFFGGQYFFLQTVIAVSLLALACSLAAVVWRETRDRLVSWAFFCVAAVGLLSPVASENLTWPFQVGFVQVFFFASAAIAALVLATGSSSSAWRGYVWTGLGVLAALAASYSLANGLLVWPVLLLLALALRLGRWPTLAVAVAGALTAFSYVWHFEPVKGHASYRDSLSHPIAMLKYVAAYLGSPLRPMGIFAAAFVGALGLLCLAALAVIGWRDRTTRSVTTPYGFGLALFIVLTAAETALGRLNFGFSQALSPRYATPSMVFWLGLLAGFLRPVLDRVRISVRAFGARRRLEAIAYLAPAVLILLAVSLGGTPDHVTVRRGVVGKTLDVLAFRQGVEDPGLLRYGVVQGPAYAMRWLQQHDRGPWAPGGLVDGSRFTLNDRQAISSVCRGTVESVRDVTGGIRLQGWIAPPSGERGSHELAIRDGSGAISGIGFVGTDRGDAFERGAAPRWSGFVAYTQSDPVRPLSIVLVARDHRSAVCSLSRAQSTA